MTFDAGGWSLGVNDYPKPPPPKPKPVRSGGAKYGKQGNSTEGKTLFQDYDSVNDVLAHLEQDRPADANNGSETHDPSDRWDLSIGYNGALDAYVMGWADGASKAQELAERIIPRPIGHRTTFSRDVAGSFPNVGAYLAGAPNAMQRISRKTNRARPYVHLYVPLAFSSSTDANMALDRGTAIVALCDALETSGCRVKITLISNTEVYSRTRLTMRFRVKDYGERLDIDQVIFTAAHPAMLRRICLGLYERSESKVVRNRTHKGYGYPIAPNKEIDTEPDGDAHIVILPSFSHKDSPEAYLEQMVRALPEKLQAEITPE